MKKILLTLIVIIGVLGLVGCAPATNNVDGYKYLTVKINPAIDFVVSDRDLVEAVIPTNVDAEIVVAELNLVQMTITEALDAYLEAVIETGYINPEEVDTEVIVEIIMDEEKDNSAYRTKIRERINNYLQNNGIFGSAGIKDSDALLAKAEELGIDVTGLPLGKVKAMVIALETNPELDIAELMDMTVGEIIKLIGESTKEHRINAALKDEFKLAQEEIRGRYAVMFALGLQIRALTAQIENHTGTTEELAVLQANLQVLLDEFNPLKVAFMAEVAALRESYRTQNEALRDEQKAVRKNRSEEFKERGEEARQKAKISRAIRREIAKRQNDEEFNPFVGEENSSQAFRKGALAIRANNPQLFVLRQEINTLTKELRTSLGSEQEKEALALEIAAKQAQFDEMKARFYTEMGDLAKEVRKAARKGQK